MAAHAHDDRDRNGASSRAKKPLPHSIVCEASILGGILLRNDTLNLLDTLEVDDFYHWPHKIVFEAIRNLQQRDEPIDISTLEAEIARHGKIDAVGGFAFLGELAMHVPTVDNVLSYAKVVRDHSMLRKLALTSAKAAERATEWEYEADELLGETLADLQKIERGYRDAGESIPVITVGAALDELERLARTPTFATPFPAMNAALGFDGLLGGQVYYLCGGTGFGKTSFIATVVRGLAEQQRPTVVAFYEMFAAYYVARMSAAILGVSANRILRGGVDRHAIERSLPSGYIEFLDAPSMTLLRRLADRHVRAGRGAPLIVVDYVQLLGNRILAGMSRPDARLANAQASEGLRDLAKSTGAAVIAVSAAGRAASRKLAADVRKTPARELIDVSRESGSIEFDGAGVIVLSVSDERDGTDQIATISLAKARFGETQHIDARYAGATGDWREIGRVAVVPKIAPKPDDGAVRSAILQVLSKGPQATKTKIYRESGKAKQAVFSELDIMLEDGAIEISAGVYCLAGWFQTGSGTDLQTKIPEVVP